MQLDAAMFNRPVTSKRDINAKPPPSFWGAEKKGEYRRHEDSLLFQRKRNSFPPTVRLMEDPELLEGERKVTDPYLRTQ